MKMCSGGIRKTKSYLELNLVRDMKNNKEDSISILIRGGRQRRMYPPLINEKGEQAVTDIEKAEVLNKFLASVCLSQASHNFHVSEPGEVLEEKNFLSL